MKYLSLITLFFYFNLTGAAQVIIELEASAYKGETVSLIAFDDLVTYSEKTLVKSIVTENGTASLTATVPAVAVYLLRINDINGLVYLEQSGQYQLQFPQYDTVLGAILSSEKFVSLTVASEPTPLNEYIAKFNFAYDTLVNNNLPLFITGKAKPITRNFELLCEENFINKFPQSFYKNHVKFNLANLKLLAGVSKRSVFESLSLDTIAYQNQACFDFLSNFYDDYFSRFSLSKHEQKLNTALNINPNFDTIVSVLAKDVYLANTELASIIALRELYFKIMNSNKPDSVSLQNVIQAQSNANSEIKKIAKNIELIAKSSWGKQLPIDFEFTNSKGEKLKLSDFRGRYVYLDFWATWCAPCIKEMPVLNKMHQEYADDLVVLSISIDKSKSRYTRYTENSPWQWQFAHLSDCSEAVNQFSFKVIPMYYLIDPDGVIKEAPARSPSQGMEQYFSGLKIQQQRELNTPKIWDWNQKMKR